MDEKKHEWTKCSCEKTHQESRGYEREAAEAKEDWIRMKFIFKFNFFLLCPLDGYMNLFICTGVSFEIVFFPLPHCPSASRTPPEPITSAYGVFSIRIIGWRNIQKDKKIKWNFPITHFLPKQRVRVNFYLFPDFEFEFCSFLVQQWRATKPLKCPFVCGKK